MQLSTLVCPLDSLHMDYRSDQESTPLNSILLAQTISQFHKYFPKIGFNIIPQLLLGFPNGLFPIK
jgi:hypothetical protein